MDLIAQENSFQKKSPIEFDALMKLYAKFKDDGKFIVMIKQFHNAKLKNRTPLSKHISFDMFEWICNCTNFLDKQCSLQQRIEWILAGRTVFPVCAICGLPISDPTRFNKQKMQYLETCCKEHAKTLRTRKINAFIQQHDDYYTNRTNATKKTNNLRYGVDNVFQLQIVKDKSKQTKLERYGNKNFVNTKLIQQRKQQHREADPEFDEKIKQKKQDTYERHYGASHNMKSKKGKCEYLHALHKKYGNCIDNVSQIQSVKTKKIQTNRAKTGKDYFFQTEIFRRKSQNTLLRKYGVKHISQVPNVQKKQRKHCEFDGMLFDSKQEMMFFTFFKLKNIKVEYNNGDFFEYEVHGKTHRYFPDFFFPGLSTYVELKGDHFFTADGKMHCPFRNKKWTSEKQKLMNELYEAKHQCMIKNGVVIVKMNSLCMKFIRKEFAHMQKS